MKDKPFLCRLGVAGSNPPGRARFPSRATAGTRTEHAEVRLDRSNEGGPGGPILSPADCQMTDNRQRLATPPLLANRLFPRASWPLGQQKVPVGVADPFLTTFFIVASKATSASLALPASSSMSPTAHAPAPAGRASLPTCRSSPRRRPLHSAARGPLACCPCEGLPRKGTPALNVDLLGPVRVLIFLVAQRGQALDVGASAGRPTTGAGLGTAERSPRLALETSMSHGRPTDPQLTIRHAHNRRELHAAAAH